MSCVQPTIQHKQITKTIEIYLDDDKLGVVHLTLLSDKGDVVAGHPTAEQEDDAERKYTEDIVQVETGFAVSVSGEDQFHILLLEVHPLLAPIMPVICCVLIAIVQLKEFRIRNG